MSLVQRVIGVVNARLVEQVSEDLARALTANQALEQEVKRLTSVAAALQGRVQDAKAKLSNVESAMVKSRDRRIEKLKACVERLHEDTRRVKARNASSHDSQRALVQRLREITGEEVFRSVVESRREEEPL